MTDILDRARSVLNDITALDGDCKLIDVAFIHELMAEVERLRRAVDIEQTACDEILEENANLRSQLQNEREKYGILYEADKC